MQKVMKASLITDGSSTRQFSLQEWQLKPEDLISLTLASNGGFGLKLSDQKN